MRLWSLHPKYLDSKGLVALWRETLLAKHVLPGLTKGYKNHPQLNRFKKAKYPIDCINQYLTIIYTEALIRGFNFDKDKIDWEFRPTTLTVTKGQLKYEKKHLLNKLRTRNKVHYNVLLKLKRMDVHPLFKVIDVGIEDWEII